MSLTVEPKARIAKGSAFLIPIVAAGVLGVLLGAFVVSAGTTPEQDQAAGAIESCEAAVMPAPSHVEEPWDSKDVRRASILQDGCLFRMWYAGTDSSHSFRIGYAISEDGVNWIRHQTNPVLVPGEEGEWDARSVWDPWVVTTPDGFQMWYTGQDSKGRTRIGMSESVNGVDWIKCPCNPVLDLEPDLPWEARGVSQPTVMYDGNTYRMWYVGESRDDSAPYAIGYAASTDGRYWERYGQVPVLDAASGEEWERQGVLEPAVLASNSGYQMWYTGIDNAAVERVGIATSVDGVHWDRHSGNPVLSPRTVETWESKGVLSPVVLQQDGAFHLWYFGSDIKSDGRKVRIGHAMSPDGIEWDRDEQNPVFSVSPGGKYQNP